MNHIYRLIWNALHQIWIAVAEFAHAYKKTAIVGAGIALNIMLFNAEAATGTQNITLIGDRNDYLLQEVTDIDGISGAKPDEKGSDGKAAYIFKTNNGVTADNNLISADKNTVIEGGKGGNGYANGNSPNVGLGGNGGEAINGDRLKINNNGDIKGGKGGTGGVSLDFKYGILGGNGGIAIHGNYLVIDNNKNSTISGGDGGHHGGYGATAILGNHLVINNKGLINGGTGAYGGYGANYINAGNAGAAIKGTNLKIYNSRSILGGNAQNGGYFLNNHTNTPIIGKGGHGGTAILGDNLEIINDTRGNIHGGNGGRNGLGSFDSQGGIGGDAINGNHLTIDNWGEIYGGQGYTGGNGGTGINGNNLKITNNSTGKINGGHGSNGGNAIAGANLTITNSGKIIKGQGDKAVGGKDDVVISLLSGKNSLTLKTGSDIQGDIDLAKGADNFLHIISDAKTTINGNLIAQDNTTVILSGKQVSFSQNAEFGDQTTLTFSEHASLHANKIIFDNTKISTNITNWDQNDIILASTDNGISGNYKHITNNLVSTGAKDYAGAILINEKKELAYGLKWNDLSGDSHGTFDLKEDSILNLHVKLKNNDHRNNNDWDGKSLTKDGLGILQLTTENNYTGTTNINNGTLKLGVANAIVNTSKLTVAKESILNLGGNNQIIQQLDNYGKILINDLKSQSLTKKITIKGNMYNSGTLVLNNCNNCAGQVYIQEGDWVGNNGTVQFGAVLDGDESITDILDIRGSASGTTKVKVINEGGKGAKTLEGIKLIITEKSGKDAFVQDGRITAGSYEYYLQQGTNSGNKMNIWYLTSQLNADEETRVFRPEVGSYANNLAAANTLFNMRLQDRQSNDWYTDIISGDNKYDSVWLRIIRGRNKNMMSDQQTSSVTNRTIFQIGGHILTGSIHKEDKLYIGLIGGYGKQSSNTHNHLSKYSSHGIVEGYSTGIYSTWYQQPHQRTGIYLDSWLMYNWFHNTVQGEQLAKEKYHSHGITASLETGYEHKATSYQTAGGMQNDLYIRPQAQIEWLNVKANDHTEYNGTNVYGEGNGNIQARLGMRLSLDMYYRTKESSIRVEPFFEINWLHNSKDYGVKMEDASSNIRGYNNLSELKVGLETRIKDHLRLWLNVSQQHGKYEQRNTQSIAGIKYTF